MMYDLQQFFHALFEWCRGGTIEFRYLPSRKQTFWPIEKLPRVPDFPKDQNVFFAVATRNGGGRKEHILQIPALWCDIDFKDTAESDPEKKLKECPLPPSIVLTSGGGYHAYWLLKEPAEKSDIQTVESILRRMAHYLQGDSGATDASRVMRVPGSLNLKYSPPRRSSILHLDPSRRYDLSDFDPWLPEDKKVIIGGQSKNPLGWEEEAIKGAQVGSRHKTALSLAGRYVQKGLSDSEIAQFLVSWNQKNTPPKPSLSDPKSEELLALIKYARQKQAGPKSRSDLQFPENVMAGVAGQFSELYASYLEVPVHFFYIGFLTCLGNVLANRVTLVSEIAPQPRLYTLLLGESADDRKSTALIKVVEFFKETFNDFSVCWGVGSAEGLQKRLKENSQLLLCVDEFKQFVNKCKIEASVLLPCVNTLFESNRYESRTKKTDIYLEDAYLSLLGASTVQTYERIWDSSFTDIGFNNRLFLVPGTGERKHSFPMKVPDREKSSLKKHLAKILSEMGQRREFDMSPTARQLYHEWYMKIERSVHTKRLDTYALRLMALIAVNDGEDKVNEVVVRKAITLADWQYQVRQEHDPIDADTKTAKMEEKIRRALHKGILNDRDLKRYTNAHRVGLWVYTMARRNLLESREIKFNRNEGGWERVG